MTFVVGGNDVVHVMMSGKRVLIGNLEPSGILIFVAEKRLKDSGYLESHSREYFSKQTYFSSYGIEDDHKPFLAKGG